MTEEQLQKIARTIYAEGSVFCGGKGHDALIAIAQCIHDLLPTFSGDLDRCLRVAFTATTAASNAECLLAAREVFEDGERRFPDARILQYRSFKKYSDGHGKPDKNKLAYLYKHYTYLGSDSISDEWGHFYFGQPTKQNFKLLLIAGHGRDVDGGGYDPGACGQDPAGNTYQEATLTRDLVPRIKQVADQKGVACEVAPDKNYYQWFKHGHAADFPSPLSEYNYVLEVHFNASTMTDYKGDGKKIGTMLYIDQSEKGHSVEDCILRNMINAGSVKAWDGVVVTQRQYASGLMVQNHIRQGGSGPSHAVLETAFVSDYDDLAWYHQHRDAIAEAVVDGIIEGYGLRYRSTEVRGVDLYEVRITADALNIRKGPGTDYPVVDTIRGKGSYHITAEADGKGATRWGRLASGAGWISLDYTSR